MKRILLVSGIVVLVLLAIGATVFWWLQNKGREMTKAIEAATIDLSAALAGSLQKVEVERRFVLDALTTTVHLRIKNSGKASCEYKLLEYKLADQPPREAMIPFEVARLDPGEVKEIQLTFENVPWEWTDQEAQVFETQKSSSRTLPPKDAPPGQKLGISSSGEWSGSNPVKLDADEFKRVLPILKDSYPKFAQSVSVGATAKLDGDRTAVVVTFSNKGDLPLLDFTLIHAKLGGNGDLAGEIEPASPASPSEIKPGESRTFKVNFTNCALGFLEVRLTFPQSRARVRFSAIGFDHFEGKDISTPEARHAKQRQGRHGPFSEKTDEAERSRDETVMVPSDFIRHKSDMPEPRLHAALHARYANRAGCALTNTCKRKSESR